jgi:hypothetical protein
MRNLIAMITQSELKQILHYCPNSGVFTWLVNLGSRARIGSIAGCDDGQGYRVIRVGGKSQGAHRLAWLYVNGTWPSQMIDHINRDKADNRIANLREVDKSTNAMNRGAQCNNKLGIKGVCWSKSNRRWMARTQAGNTVHQGHFDTIAEAVSAQLKWEELAHGTFASRTNLQHEVAL